MTDTFWSKVSIGLADDCWPWTRSLRRGYGVYWNGRKHVAAHRHSVILSGRSLPNGMVVDHTCRNPACVNPSHLRVVDRYTNVHENSDAIAFHNAQKTHCVQGHLLSGSNLYVGRSGTKRVCRICKNKAARVADRKRRLGGDSPASAVRQDAPEQSRPQQ